MFDWKWSGFTCLFEGFGEKWKGISEGLEKEAVLEIGLRGILVGLKLREAMAAL